MLSYIKKLHRHGDELLNLALILSLIRVDPDSYLGYGRSNSMRGAFHNITMGDTWGEMPFEFHRSLLTNLPNTPYLHPKGVEASLVQYQEELIEDLNNLGRYNDVLPNFNLGTITAYLLDESSTVNHNLSAPISPQVDSANPNPSSSILASVGPSTSHQTFLDYRQPPSSNSDTLNSSSSSDISVEDADLIEILWKQDLDLGITRDHFLFPGSDQSIEDIAKEKLDGNKVGISKTELTEENKEKADEKTSDVEDDPWAGLSYTIDDETGEYILLETSSEESADSGCEADNLPAEEQAEGVPFSLDKALGFARYDSNDFDEDKLSESNFTLGAQSPDSDPELIGESDPLLGLIATAARPSTAASVPLTSDSDPVFDQLLAADVPLHEPSTLDSTEFDLGFCFEDSLTPPIPNPLNTTAEGETAETLDAISEELEASLEDMIQTAQMHPRSLQVRMPLMRTMSMEHRWQDLANFLSLPDGANLSSHHHHHHHAHSHGHHHPSLGHSLTPHSHPFAHPYPHPHSPHGSIHNPHGYGVHPAAAAAAAAAAVGHHHYTGAALAPAATPVAAYTNTDAGRTALLQNASMGSPLTEIGTNGTYPSPGHGVGVSLGSAVTASMNLTNTTESLEPAVQVAYKTESTSDMQLYYQNTTSEVNQTGDGFFPSIFNEDDLQLMDMAITDSMYTPRMLDSQAVGHGIVLPSGANATAPVVASAIDTASDSAISSMGSERGPSIAEGDWIDNSASDSNATSSGATAVSSGSAYGMEYSSGAKYRHYDYTYNARQNGLLGAVGGTGADVLSSRGGATAPQVAQKKHHLFGKRVFHDQSEMPGSPVVASPSHLHKYNYNASAAAGSVYSHPSTPLDNSSMHSMEMKYGCGMEYTHHPHDARGMDHIHHNHSYAMGSEANVESQRPISRDKHRASNSGVRGNVSDNSVGPGTSGSCSESEAYSRDEKRARGMNIPMSVDDIINLPMDEFNERLSKYDLTEPQLSLIRDIRRRGKNKVAAQNCRKRKLDQILSLADEVKRARERKLRLNKEREFLLAEKARIKDRFAQLYRHVFQSLRDPDGLPYSPYEYSLQQSADGNILLVPRASTASHSGAPIDPQPSRPLLDSSAGMPNISGIQHGARRKTPDHKNEP